MGYDDDDKKQKKKKGGKYRNWKWVNKGGKIKINNLTCRGEDTSTYGAAFPWLQPGTEKGDLLNEYYNIKNNEDERIDRNYKKCRRKYHRD